MIVLPDEDEKPVGAQVQALIGAALRQSVAGAEPSAGFAQRLAAALDAAAQAGGQPAEPATAGAQTEADAAVPGAQMAPS